MPASCSTIFLPINCNHIISVTMRLRQSVWIGKERGKSDHDVFVRKVGDGPIINTVHPLPELLISVCSHKMEVDSGVGSCLREPEKKSSPAMPQVYVSPPSQQKKSDHISNPVRGGFQRGHWIYTFFRPSLVNEATPATLLPLAPKKEPK